jgi:uracil-DNA glycosylase
MAQVQEEVWENSKKGEGPCDGCPNEKGRFNHPGFFNPEADILVVEECPSKNHFNFPNYDRSNDYEWYKHYFEEVNGGSIAKWPPVRLFLAPIFSEFGYTREDVFDLVFMTSAVKCPTNNLRKSYGHCGSYLERELEEFDPEVVITAGKKPTKWTAHLLGVPRSETRALSISKPEWWGLSDFDSDIPMIHAPHWGYYNTHHRLSDDEWDHVIESVQSGLRSVGFE